MIYVRSKEGSVLMPTERCGKIGYLLRHGKAHVVVQVANRPSVNIKTIKFLKRLKNNILVEETDSKNSLI